MLKKKTSWEIENYYFKLHHKQIPADMLVCVFILFFLSNLFKAGVLLHKLVSVQSRNC